MFEVFSILIGIIAIIFNKSFANNTIKYQRAMMGNDYSDNPKLLRVASIVVGLIFIIFGILGLLKII